MVALSALSASRKQFGYLRIARYPPARALPTRPSVDVVVLLMRPNFVRLW